jgi:hypothetical protein
VGNLTITSIVEGEGEEIALPILLRRIAGEGAGRWDVTFPPPHRHGRGSIVAPGGIERFVETAAILQPRSRGILVLIDADDDCPAEWGPRLTDRARQARPDKHVGVVLANREFEAWFLAAASSLAGTRGLAADLVVPPDPEKPRGCKEWLTAHRTDGRSYSPTTDQAALAARFDLRLARANSPSFAKFCREVESFLA